MEWRWKLPGFVRIFAFLHKHPQLSRRNFDALGGLYVPRYDVVIDRVPESTGERAVLAPRRT